MMSVIKTLGISSEFSDCSIIFMIVTMYEVIVSTSIAEFLQLNARNFNLPNSYQKD
jgi:hypothetical protein